MICVIALIVFGILGIFSAAYRRIALEALDCVFRRVTLRKCESGLDQRLKSRIVGKLLRKSPKAGRFVFRHFEAISWVFTVLLIASLVFVIIGGINYYRYGNCYGPASNLICPFDISGAHSQITDIESDVCTSATQFGELTLEGVDLSMFPTINGSNNELIVIGCYLCENTRNLMPTINELLTSKPTFIFAHLPVKKDTEYLSEYTVCIYEQNQEEFWKFHNKLFEVDETKITHEFVEDYVKTLNINQQMLNDCLNSTKELVNKQITELEKTNVQGTPTSFVNGQPIIGSKPKRVFMGFFK